MALLVVGGCGIATGLLGGERPGLGASNDSDIRIDLVLNGELLATLEPDTGMQVASKWRMPDLPWKVEARTEAGRVLVTMTVTAEDLVSTGHMGTGVDLPGGRFTVWAGTEPSS